MTAEERIQENRYTKELDQFIHFAFDDLVEVAQSNHKLFEELYYNRKSQCDDFYSIMHNGNDTAQNVLIIGDAGVGKTSFMHKLLINCKAEKIFTIFMDYRKITPRTTDGLINSFLNQLEKYFDVIGYPIHTLKPNVALDINFQAAYNHLDNIPKSKLNKQLVLFLDDFDYAEDEWFDLLKYFLPFSNNNKTSLVLSVRPNLLTAIDEYDDRFRNSYIKKARQMVLGPISVENVISTRLAPILVEKENTNKLYGVISNLFKRESELCKLAKKYGTIVDNLPRFEYPLTIKHNTFMQRITSGDLRETFDIAYESLKYIINNEKLLESELEDGISKKVIGREGVMKIFADNKEASYKIFNLHTFRSKKYNNSLFFNVLEAIRFHGIADDKFYAALKKLGHEKKLIDDAINELSSKKHRFFFPAKNQPKQVKQNIEYYREYIPLDKLDMYLEMAKWNEYINRFGETGKSIEEYL